MKISPPSIVPFFMLYEIFRKYQSFFFDVGSKVPRCRPIIWFKFPCACMRNRFWHFYHDKTHASKPYSPIHVSPHLSTFDESELFSHFVVFWGAPLASVVLTWLCMDVDSEDRTLNIIYNSIAEIKLAPWKKMHEAFIGHYFRASGDNCRIVVPSRHFPTPSILK